MTLTVETQMSMSLSVLRVDYFTSPIPIPGRRTLTAVAVLAGAEIGESALRVIHSSLPAPILLPLPSLEEPDNHSQGNIRRRENCPGGSFAQTDTRSHISYLFFITRGSSSPTQAPDYSCRPRGRPAYYSSLGRRAWEG